MSAVVAVAVLVGTVRLWGPGVGPPGDLPAGTDEQLAFLDAAVAAGAAERMQRWFPEGYVFTQVLPALAGIDAALQDPGGGRRERSLARADAALAALDGPAGRAAFPDLPPDGAGAFHASWTAYLAAGRALLAGTEQPDAADAALQERCAAFDALVADGVAFPPSYVDQAWPVDVLPGLVALRVCDRLGLGSHEATVTAWLDDLPDHLDPATGLLPHRTDASTGVALEGPRATSSSLILRFLVDLDPELAARYRDAYVATFVRARLSLPAVLEHSDGRWTGGDVDSGPLVAGVSVSAAAVTLGAARVTGAPQLADDLARAGEAFGGPLTLGGHRRYAAGAVPVGDAFVVWSRAATPWLETAPAVVASPVPRWWRVPWTVLGALVGSAAAWAAITGRATVRRHASSPP